MCPFRARPYHTQTIVCPVAHHLTITINHFVSLTIAQHAILLTHSCPNVSVSYSTVVI